MFCSGRITVLLILSLVLTAASAGAELFELPDSSAAGGGAFTGSSTSTTPPPPRTRAAQATLAEHAVYYAFTELGIGPEKQTEVALKMARMESVRGLPPEKAFVVGVRVAGRIQREVNQAAGPASLAARNTLSELATHRTALPLATTAPANAASRLENAIAAAKAAIVANRPRFEYTKWLNEAVAELAPNP